ncbi:hypothetical protein ASPBRDRAFT_55249 [Aspergillus brasiliensis CBS 101740]|uniref:Uncharacterized protein n=1 Tax=Aspergillus brasiliensis (strain CBS 101740 / IMI 381727 / IBT 21946) TaxID=767769 RepID=A0A1L9UK44_ASPBC|nr:hypothetical protein ASPBRDRAFT_55249 [Aspergillus brasiliensis CBS 101740]
MSGKAEHLMRGERQSGRERSSEETTCDGGGQTVDQDPQHGDPSVAMRFVHCLEGGRTDGLTVLDGRSICSALNEREDLAHFSPDCQGEGFSGLPFLLPSVTQPWHARRGMSILANYLWGSDRNDSKGGRRRQTGQTDRNAGRTGAQRLVPQGKLACGVTARASSHLRTCPTPAHET